MGEIAAKLENGQGRVILSGGFSVQHADQLREALHATLVDGTGIEIDISSVESVDITFFQLFESLLKTARSMGKNVFISGAVPPEVLQCAADLGLSRGSGLVADILAR